MATLSPARAGFPLVSGLELLSRGKVRDTYRLGNGLLLVVATDGISIFDFVLNALVPMKGIILTAMNHFWLTKLTGLGFKTHLVAAGVDIDSYLPEALRGNAGLQSRAMVVKELKMAGAEFVFRDCLTGSGLKEYLQTGELNGHMLPKGLQDGDRLPYVIFDPTTKEEVGHDERISAEQIAAKYPKAVCNLIDAFQVIKSHAESCGIVFADTKFEGSADELGDEVGTPDSSRFWDLREWLASRKPEIGRKAPSALDKQRVRVWGIGEGINKLDPSNPADVAKVHSLVLPELVICQTTQIYRYIFWRLTGYTIEQYLRNKMGILVEDLEKPIAIVLGSKSDLPKVQRAVDHAMTLPNSKVAVHILSCHRNPRELRKFVESGCMGAQTVICAGSKAFALPGAMDAEIHAASKDIRVVGVALGEPGSEDLLAAQLSISQLPGTPVVMDEVSGSVYTGQEGLWEAINRVIKGELPPLPARVAKPAEFNIQIN